MTEVQRYQKDYFQNEKKTRIHISGSLTLQNELFSHALANSTGYNCTYTSRNNLPNLLKESRGTSSIVLWDCVDTELEDIWDIINQEFTHGYSQFALFNLGPAQIIETQAVRKGIRGIFYREDPLSTYIKGIQAILHGQLWVSREILEKCLVESDPPAESFDEKQISLTFREQEILSMIAAGLSKDDIAGDLCISPHTVKTHTHNIYQKINVTNRIKAALWATQNLKYPKKTYRQMRGADDVA